MTPSFTLTNLRLILYSIALKLGKKIT
jgi:hypothetical protein